MADSGVRRRVDLNGEQPPVVLQHEVDRLAVGGAPVEHLRGKGAHIGEGEQVAQDQVRQMGIPRRRLAGQVQSQTRVGPVDLGRLDEPLGPGGRVGGQQHQQVRGFQQFEVSAHRCRRQVQVAAEAGGVEGLADGEAGRGHEPAEVRRRPHGRQVVQIALQISAHVASEPHRSLFARSELGGGNWEAAPKRQVRPGLGLAWLRGDDVRPVSRRRPQQIVPGAAPPGAAQLPPRHGPQGQIAGPTGQRLGDLAHEQQVG